MSKRPEPPRLARPIIETHCHLDRLTQRPTDALVELAQAANISAIVTIAVDPESLSTVRELAARYTPVWCTQGIHPHEAQTFNTEIADEIAQHTAEDKVVAVGEIGLDYYYDYAPAAVQRDVFERQLHLAANAELPIVVHSREAEADSYGLLREHANALHRKGVIHSFTSSVDFAEQCLALGFYLGFNGIITFKNADNVRAALRTAPLERIVLETDAPYLAPVPYRGRENSPLLLPFVAQAVAEIKGVDIDEVLETTTANAINLFAFNGTLPRDEDVQYASSR